jgi:hypothetical protein
VGLSIVTERHLKTRPIQAQSTAMTQAMASIGNEDRARFGVASRRAPASLRLAPQDGDWRAPVLATGLATHAGAIEGRSCNHVGRASTDATSAGLLAKLRRERRQLCGKPTALAWVCCRTLRCHRLVRPQ